jgi:biopolymer transport protein ExbD
MAGSHNSDPGGMISGINMTPLVDIMLVLLIIFLVTAKLSVSPPNAIQMNLPKSATGDGIQVVLAVNLGKDGEVDINGNRLPNDDAIIPFAKSFRAAHPDVRAVIQADGKVFHERDIHVLDLLSQAGIDKIAFGVDLTPIPPAAGAPPAP